MRVVADDNQIEQLVSKLAEAIGRDVTGRPWAIVGIRSRGDDLARRLAARLKPDHLGCLDITLYRDDLSEIGPQPVVRTTDIAFDINDIPVVLVDDVLMTGRSVRAALQSLMDLGRPSRVWLSVLVDRGGRELPIKADHIAMDLSADHGEHVNVSLKPTDQVDQIAIVERGGA